MRSGSIALLVALASAEPAEAGGLSLADALAAAVERGPDAVAARTLVPVARADVHTARMLPNPSLTVGAGVSEPILAASTTWRLPIFGQRGAHVAAAERAVDQAAAERDATLWRLRHDARVAYFTASRADADAAIAVEVAAIAERIAAIARERYEVGAGSRLDDEQAALVRARAVDDVRARRSASRVARIDLARRVGMEAATLVDATLALTDPLDAAAALPSPSELAEGAARRHPELARLEVTAIAAEARAVAARSEIRPTPAVDIGFEVLDPSTCGATATGRCIGPRGALALDLPILNWNGGPVERARAEVSAARAQAEAVRARIRADLAAAGEALEAATARARYYDEQDLPAALRIEQMAREGFASGKTGLLPLLEAERAVLESRLARTAAQLDVQVARADLEEASGVPLR